MSVASTAARLPAIVLFLRRMLQKDADDEKAAMLLKYMSAPFYMCHAMLEDVLPCMSTLSCVYVMCCLSL